MYNPKVMCLKYQIPEQIYLHELKKKPNMYGVQVLWENVSDFG